MAMDEKKKGRIALAILRWMADEDGVHISPEKVRRSVGRMAKATGIPKKDLSAFLEEEVRRFVDRTFLVVKAKRKRQ